MLKIEITLDTLSATVKGNEVGQAIQDLHVNGIEKLLSYGFQRFINDACGGEKTEEEVKGIITKQIAKLISGEVGRSGSGRKSISNQVKAQRSVLLSYFQRHEVMKTQEAKKYIQENDLDHCLGQLFNKIASKVLKKSVTSFTHDDLGKIAAMRGKNEGRVLQEIEEEKARLDSAGKVEIEEEDLENVEI